MKPPVFVFGAARSGTTLTYSVLLSAGVFPVYEAESRILECASRYGSLRSRRNRQAFLTDFFDSRQYARSGLSRDLVAELAERRSSSWVDFLDGFMSEICRAQAKDRWVEKSPNNMQFVDRLDAYYPEAKFIHVVRDGRSVAVSQRRHGGTKYSRDPRRQLIWIGNVWDQQVRAGRRAARLGPSRYLEIRYEDLAFDLPGSLERLGRFADIELDVATVNASEVGALGRPNTDFDMSRGGVNDRAVERWRSLLGPDEIGLLNWQLGPTLREVGYSVERAGGMNGPSLRDRAFSRLARSALDLRHTLNVKTPLGRFARKPLELGLS